MAADEAVLNKVHKNTADYIPRMFSGASAVPVVDPGPGPKVT